MIEENSEESSRRKEILELARQVASIPGDDLINDLVQARSKLQLKIIKEFEDESITLQQSRDFEKDVEFMTAVIESARNMKKLVGEDTESVLKERKVKAMLREVFGKLDDNEEGDL